MSAKGSHTGFTLVEILVAMTIGLFLTAGMIQMYVSNKQTYRFSEALSRIQENGRYALSLIARDMRLADFWGCSTIDDLRNLVDRDSSFYDPNLHGLSAGIDGIEGASGSLGNPDNPDSITLRGAVGSGMVVALHNATFDPVTVADSLSNVRSSICGDIGCLSDQVADMVAVSNCQGGNIFQATMLTPSGGNTQVRFNEDPPPDTPGNLNGTALSAAYDQTASLFPLRVATYCVNDGPRCDNPGSIENRSLNLIDNGTSREVVEGVANMQIAYGEDMDDDGTVDRYVPRANVTDMGAVVSVRINLLLTSAEDNLVDQPQQVTFDDYDGAADDTFTASDRRLYQVLTATFALRNRSL